MIVKRDEIDPLLAGRPLYTLGNCPRIGVLQRQRTIPKPVFVGLERFYGRAVLMRPDSLDEPALFQSAQQAERAGFVHMRARHQFLQSQQFAIELKCIQKIASAQYSVDQIAVLGLIRVFQDALTELVVLRDPSNPTHPTKEISGMVRAAPE
jgi:hypothetical protein